MRKDEVRARKSGHTARCLLPSEFCVRSLRSLVHFYRNTIGMTLPNSCRYHPTCSQYALDALSEYGAAKGAWMALKRIARCHPWSTGGYDPVPRKVRSQNVECRMPDLPTERRATRA